MSITPRSRQAILDEKDRLKDELTLYQFRTLNAEASARLLEHELREVKAELKALSLCHHFPAS